MSNHHIFISIILAFLVSSHLSCLSNASSFPNSLDSFLETSNMLQDSNPILNLSPKISFPFDSILSLFDQYFNELQNIESTIENETEAPLTVEFNINEEDQQCVIKIDVNDMPDNTRASVAAIGDRIVEVTYIKESTFPINAMQHPFFNNLRGIDKSVVMNNEETHHDEDYSATVSYTQVAVKQFLIPQECKGWSVSTAKATLQSDERAVYVKLPFTEDPHNINQDDAANTVYTADVASQPVVEETVKNEVLEGHTSNSLFRWKGKKSIPMVENEEF